MILYTDRDVITEVRVLAPFNLSVKSAKQKSTIYPTAKTAEFATGRVAVNVCRMQDYGFVI